MEWGKLSRQEDSSTVASSGVWFLHSAEVPSAFCQSVGVAQRHPTAEQIQRKYSLPSKPTRISDVQVPAGARIRTGKIEANFGGQGGATQYEWLTKEVPKTAIKNTRRLD